jgi:1,4-alpha-glucan branching enzyme
MKHILRALLLFCLYLCASPSYAQKCDDAWTTPSWAANATIYEVNIRQYTPEGTFRAFEPNLPRLRAMGVDILWLMPIYPIGVEGRKGSLGSYYAVKDYRAVNSEFGTMDDLRHLIKAAHAQGFKVILDYVANHSSPDNKLTIQHPGWYTHDSLGNIIPPVPDWSDVADFNYDEKGLRDYQIESMKYWIREADADGFRCDVAMMVPLDFWKECRIELDKVKKVFMLAEAEGPEFHRNGFDMTYGWDFMNMCIRIAKGEKGAGDLYRYFNELDMKYNEGDNIMYFTTNHDENSWNGTDAERLGAAAKVFAVLSATVPGMPLVYSGQEAGLNKRLAFFEKDTIDWDHYSQADFYSRLLHLKETNKAMLVENTDSNYFNFLLDKKFEHHFAFIRKYGRSQVLVIANLSPKPTEVVLNKDDIDGNYTELFTGEKARIRRGHLLHMEPWGYRVFVQ